MSAVIMRIRRVMVPDCDYLSGNCKGEKGKERFLRKRQTRVNVCVCMYCPVTRDHEQVDNDMWRFQCKQVKLVSLSIR